MNQEFELVTPADVETTEPENLFKRLAASATEKEAGEPSDNFWNPFREEKEEYVLSLDIPNLAGNRIQIQMGPSYIEIRYKKRYLFYLPVDCDASAVRVIYRDSKLVVRIPRQPLDALATLSVDEENMNQRDLFTTDLCGV